MDRKLKEIHTATHPAAKLERRPDRAEVVRNDDAGDDEGAPFLLGCRGG